MISEGGIVRYILVSIHSSYIKRLIDITKHKNLIHFSSFNESDLYYIETMLSTNHNTLNIELADINSVLSKQELLIINMIFKYGYSVSEIAAFCNISRQAVNQMKKKALNKIKNYYFDI